MIKQFAIFAGEDFYPLGGWSDYIKSFDTLEDAKEYILAGNVMRDWIQIVDLKTGDIFSGKYNKI